MKQVTACLLSQHRDNQIQLTAQQATTLLWSSSLAQVTLPQDHISTLSLIVYQAYEQNALPPGSLARSIYAMSRLRNSKITNVWSADRVNASAIASAIAPAAPKDHFTDVQQVLDTMLLFSAGSTRAASTVEDPLLLLAMRLVASLNHGPEAAVEEPLVALMSADEMTMMLLGLVHLVDHQAMPPATSHPNWVDVVIQQVKVSCS
jgi:hypothetical protein